MCGAEGFGLISKVPKSALRLIERYRTLIYTMSNYEGPYFGSL